MAGGTNARLVLWRVDDGVVRVAGVGSDEDADAGGVRRELGRGEPRPYEDATNAYGAGRLLRAWRRRE